PRQDALYVADAVQMLAQYFVSATVAERADGLITRAQYRLVRQRPVEPAAQLARAHSGHTFVDQGEDRGVFPSREADIQLQVAPGRRIDDQCVGALFDVQAADVRYRRFLSVAHVLQERAGGADGERQLVGAESFQIEGTHLVGEQARGTRQLEVPRRPGF